jgi:quercetin dioxygenase-like cupin family protein
MTKMTMIIKDVKDVPVRKPPYAPGIQAKILLDKSNSDSMLAGLMWWGPGAKMQPHYHSAEELQLVLHGHATLTDCNGDKHPLREGVMFHCPPGIGGTHGIENTSDFPMSLLFAYPSQEFESVPPIPEAKAELKT